MNKKKLRNIIIIFIAAIILVLLTSVKGYNACGCGGCGGVSPIFHFTLNPQKIIDEDKKARDAEICKFVGCGTCTRYYYFGWKMLE